MPTAELSAGPNRAGAVYSPSSFPLRRRYPLSKHTFGVIVAPDRLSPSRAEQEAASARGLTALPSHVDNESTADMERATDIAARADVLNFAADRRLERLGPHRVAEIRDRLANGVYASRPVLERVAQRLLESGDIF